MKNTPTNTNSALSDGSNEVLLSEGKVRPSKQSLQMPTDDQIKVWFGRLKEKYGHTKVLMCETVLLTGLRSIEVACWRVNTLPEKRADWHISNVDAARCKQKVRLNITCEKKWAHYFKQGEKIASERLIWIPLDLAERIDEYRWGERELALKRCVKAAPTAVEQKHQIENAYLFLNDKTGKPINVRELHRAWRGVELPCKGWSTHTARALQARSDFFGAMKKHQSLCSNSIDAAAPLASRALSESMQQIQQQLNHTLNSTTANYLLHINSPASASRDNSELVRWRSLNAQDVLSVLADYAKQDCDFKPRTSHRSTRWHATANGFEFEILCTGPKFLDTRGGKGGGGAVDLAMHLLGLDFKQAICLLRCKGV
jgi:integrase